MPSLHVKSTAGEWNIAGSSGLAVSEMLHAAGIRLRVACGGVGSCGLCRICVEEGKVSPPAFAELSRLSEDELRRGIRLACQVRPLGDVRIRIEATALAMCWTSLPGIDENPVALGGRSGSAPEKRSLGIAVDLGTSQIRVALWDLETKSRLAGCYGPNPQADFGADVLTRLTLAAGFRKCARELSWLARGAIGDALSNLSASTAHSLRNIKRVVVVGNTAMLRLLAGKDPGLLLQPEFWTRDLDCQPEDTEEWTVAWGIDPKAIVAVVPPAAGFVGSDLLAAVLATRLTEDAANALLVDFGTNSEIGLWDGQTLWATSVPGGPAFEGSGLSCGMPAEPGAIFRMERVASDRELRCEVIGGIEPLGICGSGLVDAIASLVAEGALRSTGRFAKSVGGKGVVIARGQRNIVLKPGDVDVFQRAKAATAAGIACVLERAGRSPKDLQRVCVCGAFGRNLNVRHAQAVGLLPALPVERVELRDNAALNGCELLLLSGEKPAGVESLKQKIKIINMAEVPEFEERFVEQLLLRPMPSATLEAL